MWNLYLKYTVNYKVTERYPIDVLELMYPPDNVTALRLSLINVHHRRVSYHRGSHYNVTSTETWGAK